MGTYSRYLAATLKTVLTGLLHYGDAWWHRITVLEVAQFQGPLDSPWCLDVHMPVRPKTSEERLVTLTSCKP